MTIGILHDMGAPPPRLSLSGCFHGSTFSYNKIKIRDQPPVFRYQSCKKIFINYWTTGNHCLPIHLNYSFYPTVFLRRIHSELDKSPNLCSGHPMTRYLVKIEQFRENYWGAISPEEDNACTYCKSLESIYGHIYTDRRNYYCTRGARSRLNM